MGSSSSRIPRLPTAANSRVDQRIMMFKMDQSANVKPSKRNSRTDMYGNHTTATKSLPIGSLCKAAKQQSWKVQHHRTRIIITDQGILRTTEEGKKKHVIATDILTRALIANQDR